MAVLILSILSASCAHKKIENFTLHKYLCSEKEVQKRPDICDVKKTSLTDKTETYQRGKSNNEQSKTKDSAPSHSRAAEYLPDQSKIQLFQIIAHTIEHNNDIRIEIERQNDNKHGIAVAQSTYFPQVDFTAGTGFENTESSSATTEGINRQEANVIVSQLLFDFGATSYLVKRAKSLYESSQHRSFDKINEVSLQVIEAYLDLFENDEIIAETQKNVDAHVKLSERVKANQANGNATIADVKRVEARLENAKATLLDVKSQKDNAVNLFQRLTKLKAQKLGKPNFKYPKAVNVVQIKQDLKNNPILLAIKDDIASFRNQLLNVNSSYYPTLNLEVIGNVREDVGGDSGQSSDVRSMIVLRQKLTDGGLRDANIRQILSRMREQEYNYSKQYEELEEAIDNVLQTAEKDSEKSKSLRESANSSQKVLELSLEQFKAGQRTIFQLLEAHDDYYNAKVALIQNTYAQLRNYYRRLNVQGNLVDTILSKADTANPILNFQERIVKGEEQDNSAVDNLLKGTLQ